MADIFAPTKHSECRFFDAGAGIGSLSSAFLERCLAGGLTFANISLTAYEIDDVLYPELKKTLEPYTEKLRVHLEIRKGDFIGSGRPGRASQNAKSAPMVRGYKPGADRRRVQFYLS